MKAILRMLTVSHLAYLEVLMLTDHCKHGNALKKHHLKPIDRPAKLARAVKLAFLTEPARNTRARQAPRTESVAGGMDQRVISQIFSFAGPPLLRRVYVRTTKYYWKPYYGFYYGFYYDYDERGGSDEEEEDGA
ncbi:hypothetical protein JG688_00002143 [Phytophthora aleatoria]|uniref:PiggyBac transposable element-derived protein domain-containing protein n=1 Tax=Phytophthora aleatoria TaxID=2496075 RepID=A0A8J5J569_9STRA|nr:hypothetical protein JG688_00002143 [Phytophthora aleatoria]